MRQAIQNKEECGSSEYLELMRNAQAEPFCPATVNAFFDEYQKRQQPSEDEKLAYLMLRCLYDGYKEKWLNELAQIYIRMDKPSLALMCLADSLRLNPNQPEVHTQLMELSKYQKPKVLEPMDCFECAVSVIMTTFNRPVEIREAIQSVLDQSFSDFELIVVNDGGSDEVERAVKSFDSDKIRYFKLEHNKGTSAASNLAISQARGKYIAYLDDDDVYYPNHLQVLVEALNNTSHKVAYTNTQAVEGRICEGKFVRDRRRWVWNQDYNRDRLAEKTFVTNTTIVHHRNLLCETGIYREDIWMSEDWELWLRLALKTDFVHLNEYTCEYRFRSDNTCRRNLHATHFFGKLVSNYHKYHQGNVACAKYYLASGDNNRAEQLYEAVKSDYETGFRTVDLIEELLVLARQFEDSKFFRQLSKDYFERAPQLCLKKIVDIKSARMLAGVFPSVPSWAVRSLVQKTLCYGKKIVRKSRKVARSLSCKLRTQFQEH